MVKGKVVPPARNRRSTSTQRHVLSALLLLAYVAFFWPSRVSAQDDPTETDAELRRCLEMVAKVYDVLSTHLADPVDPERAIYEGAVAGALSRLDPFSVFLDAPQFRALQDQQRGVQRGFGAVLSVQPGSVMVLQTVPGAPFARAGLGAGDRILRVNGVRLALLDFEELVQTLQQARSSRVRLTVMRSGQFVSEELELDPADLPSASVDKKFLLKDGLGYVHVSRIEQSTAGEIRAVLEEWMVPALPSQSERLRGLILDLRDNPGGALEGAVATAGLFLPKGDVVLSMRGRAIPERVFRVEAEPYAPGLRIVVILNSRSASAAEIIASALQEHDRAWLVGEPSFGKGVVESVLPLSQGAALVLTTARYLTPHGRSVQRPLPETALAVILDGARPFATDHGRPLGEGGRVEPDQRAEGWRLDAWAQFLEQTTALLNFAQSYLERNGGIRDDFEVTDATWEEFQQFLRGAGAEIPSSSWQQQREFWKARIQTELVNLAFGSSRADEVAINADPQVQAAIGAFERAEHLMELRGAGPAARTEADPEPAPRP